MAAASLGNALLLIFRATDYPMPGSPIFAELCPELHQRPRPFSNGRDKKKKIVEDLQAEVARLAAQLAALEGVSNENVQLEQAAASKEAQLWQREAEIKAVQCRPQ